MTHHNTVHVGLLLANAKNAHVINATLTFTATTKSASTEKFEQKIWQVNDSP